MATVSFGLAERTRDAVRLFPCPDSGRTLRETQSRLQAPVPGPALFLAAFCFQHLADSFSGSLRPGKYHDEKRKDGQRACNPRRIVNDGNDIADLRSALSNAFGAEP